MELIYRNDIRWQDLPKIESPFFAKSKVENDLTSPLPDITSGIGRNPLSKIADDYSGKVNNGALKKLLTKIEEGAVVLVHFCVDDVFRPVFKWEKDDQHPNKGYWSINNCYDTQALFEFEWVLRTVKKPQPRGSVVRSPGDAIFPGANTADSKRAVVNAGIESVNTLTDSARKRELDEYADRYPQLKSNADNPLEIDKLEYDNKPYGEFAETMVGVAGVLGTRNPSKLLKRGEGNKEAVDDVIKKPSVRKSREQALQDLRAEAKSLGVEIRTGKEADEFLNFSAKMEGVPPEKMHAVTLGDDLIMVREKYQNDVRVLREELLHTQQQKNGFEISKQSQTNAEIQVREQMIQNRDQWGLTNEEVREIISEVRMINERGGY